MSFNMRRSKPTPSPTAKACRELLKDLKPVKEWRKGHWWLCIFYLLIPAITIFYVIFPLATAGLLPDPWGGWVGAGIMLMALILSCWAIGIELNLALYNHFEVFKRAIQPLLDEGEEVLTMVRGRVFDLNIPRWLDPNITEDSYFFFTTDRLLIVCLKRGVAYKVPGGNLKTVAQMVKETQFKGMVQDVYTVSLGDLSSIKERRYVGFNILMLTHDKVEITPAYQTEPYTWLWANRGTRHGHLIKTILQRVRRGSVTLNHCNGC